MRNSVLAAEEGALKIDVQNPVPRRLGNVGYAPIFSRHDTCIVVEDIYAPECIDGCDNHLFDLVLVGDISFEKDSFAACLTNISGCLFTLFGHDISDNNASPLLCEEFCGHLTHATSSSGDDRDFVG